MLAELRLFLDIVGPIMLFSFLAACVWRTHKLRMRDMTREDDDS